MQVFLCFFAEISALPVSNSESHEHRIFDNAISTFDLTSTTKQSKVLTLSLSKTKIPISEPTNIATTIGSNDHSKRVKPDSLRVSYSVKTVLQDSRPHNAENLKNNSNGEEGIFIGVIGALKLLAKMLLATRYFTN